METFKMQFKSLDSLLDYISTNLAVMTYEEVRNYCTKYLKSVPMSIVDFDNSKFYFGQPEGGGTNLLYRARVITNSKKVGHEKVQDISFMPDDKLHMVKDLAE